MATRLVKTVARQVKPILSIDKTESRRRVLNLYKAWYRQIPHIINDHQLAINASRGRAKLRELFLKNRDVQDIRAQDLLVIKGQMELVETMKKHKQPCHVMAFFKDTVNPKPNDFLSKFFTGQE